MSEHLEIEQKFDVDDGFLRPGGRALEEALRGERGERISAGEPVLHRLSATYFDTADGRLMSRKITLRRRTGGTDAGWHLKLPAGQDSRRELREPLGDRPGEVPERLAAAAAGVTGGLPLAPIAVLETERTVVTLTAHDGRVLAEIADDVVTARRLPAGQQLRWREVEVEVPTASPELQRAAADLLLAAGARPAGHGSKLARLLNR